MPISSVLVMFFRPLNSVRSTLSESSAKTAQKHRKYTASAMAEYLSLSCDDGGGLAQVMTLS
jgi:hypothetical protein